MQEQLSFEAPTSSPAPVGATARDAARETAREVVREIARETPATRTVAYTDGACSKNPGPGGWAWAVPQGRWARGAEAATTNQRMELRAVLEALRALDGPVEIVSDSTYVVNCFRDRWWAGWRRRNWRNSQNKPVANRDLWEPLVDLVLARDVTFRWVKGHNGEPMNDLVDRLAVESARTQTDATGQSSPNIP